MASLLPRPRLPNTRQQGPRINRNPTVVDSGMQINLPSRYREAEQAEAAAEAQRLAEVNAYWDAEEVTKAAMTSTAPRGGALVSQRGMQEAPRADQYAVPSHHTQHIDMGLANRVVQDGYRADLSNRADGVLADLRGERQVDDFFNSAENRRQEESLVQQAIDMPDQRGPLRRAGDYIRRQDNRLINAFERPGLSREKAVFAAAAIEGAGLTAAGAGFYGLTSALGNAFGGPADEQERGQLGM